MQTKLRKRVLSTRKYTPMWKGFIEGFVTNFLKKNYWRVESYMTYDDAMQEAQVTFYRLKNKYGNLDRAQHFMALYRTSWVNDFNDFAILATKHRHEVCDVETDELEQYSVSGELNNDGELSVMIEQAPSDIKLVLQLLLTAPVEVLDMFSSVWKKRGKYRDFGNEHLCEILGLEGKTDIVNKINKYFTLTQV